MSNAVSKIDGFMMFSNVGGFVCHIANTVLLLYCTIFFPDATATLASAVVYLSVFAGNMLGLFVTASAGIIVNHMVRIFSAFEPLCEVVLPPIGPSRRIS